MTKNWHAVCTEWFGSYNQRLLVLASRLVTEAEAEDCVQRTWLLANRKFDEFSGGSPEAWLGAILRNVCRERLSELRNGQRGLELVTDLGWGCQSSDGESPSLHEEDIRRFLGERLPPDEFRVLTLQVSLFRTDGIARELGISERMVEKLAARARANAQRALAHSEFGLSPIPQQGIA